ncbi:tRNA pseudouridine(13) synthase TruD [Halorubrum lacusprofundi]|jgi:tRNA pseudouridine13 synthase|uniref:Probable tRNA pseudouridine synthase D n=1 Tax=Halorubrum lacusprofundi (strain ATCC 49239 / DSM 5036 / JCM 8891 / ACAM 34) TaxID=416348 RepID=B9LTP0_HALLT|nr:tRNA pseudouridine(13) synthase TruD [Halorubrum lacusprofundi]ACM56174.1 tRNA pseudouridine synthase D TruD [Halorubrum lacusprofundi ATCC 49239]MCG1005515.1 tRNA pseudouridine(13) synthase TruD [Halorubrum lacusprofundi]
MAPSIPLREAHPAERAAGIDHYVSDADGIGGRLRESPDDFRVRELEAFEPEPLGADTGSYPELVVRVTLRDWDTNDFARRISDALGISRERVSWAGTKDKRAVTTQLFTLREVDPDDLPEIRGAEIEPLGRAGRRLSFGDLAGNAFEIRVADTVPEAPERVADVVGDLRAFGGDAEEAKDDATVGVPNYFGQQRFGSRRPVTHRVGLAVVRDDFREAVRLYAGNSSDTEPDDTRAARDRVDAAFGVGGDDTGDGSDPSADGTGDGDWETCLDAIPGKLRFERSMVHRLAERDVAPDAPPDHEDWRHALEAVPSNLQRLFVNAAQSFLFNQVLSERLRRGLSFDRPVAGDVVCFADGDAPEELYAPDTDRLQRVDEDRVAVVTRHCERGRAFVTAPLIGTETDLGDGEPGEIEREVLADAGIEPGDFALPGDFDSSGTRRAILLRSDLNVTFDDGDPRFAFALPSGSYATVLLREFTKSGPLDL